MINLWDYNSPENKKQKNEKKRLTSKQKYGKSKHKKKGNTNSKGETMYAIINLQTGRVLFSTIDADVFDRKLTDWLYSMPKLQGMIEGFQLTESGWEETEN